MVNSMKYVTSVQMMTFIDEYFCGILYPAVENCGI